MDDDLFASFGLDSGDTTVGTEDVKPIENHSNNSEQMRSAKENAEALLAMMAADTEKAAKQPQKRALPLPQSVQLDDEMEVDLKRNCMNYEHRVVVHTVQTNSENCTHVVAYPPGLTFCPLIQRQTAPAKEYPFRLDAFQTQAIKCIENNQSVLVSAHTSAGKTVVALYAIAQCLREKQRVIYTSPIKALSNQKYRELEEEFGDVGLMTGDVTLNPDASCLVMTTEILRSMLYRGSELMKEIGYVVFDEIHYMRDKERGVVWEETIILMPSNIHHVFLSATIPNAQQFAEWIASIKSCPCHVVYTDYRPTPLQHYIFPVGGEGLHEVVNVQGEFREDRFAQAMTGLSSLNDKPKFGGKRKGTSGDSNVVKIIRTIKERDMMPCIVFSFSRKECEAYALSIKEMDFNTSEEKSQIEEIYKSAVSLLSDEDRKLPQINEILPLLRRGIGVHHSGLLPILKEVVEILFGESLVKTLFATETFSMGLNMPARTVLFTSARKFDGKENRWITSGEYIQMSGRAGRRGLDDKGVVILMVDAKMSNEDAKHIIKGASDPLNSQFRLTYNMVLNLMRVDGINPEFMLERSFYQFQNQAQIPILTKKIADIKKTLSEFVVEMEEDLTSYFEMNKNIDACQEIIAKAVVKPRYIAPYLHAGRLLYIVAGTRCFGWGALIDYARKTNEEDASEVVYILQVLLPVSRACENISDAATVKPPTNADDTVWEIIPVDLTCVRKVGALRLKLPAELKRSDARMSTGYMIKKIVYDRFKGNPEELDPIKDMNIAEESVKVAVEQLKALQMRKQDHPLPKRKDFDNLKSAWDKKESMRNELLSTEKELKKVLSIQQLDELAQRKRVLRRLQYCTQDDTIEKKGRVACELSAADELLLTEMLYGGVFSNLSPEQLCGLVSCFVFQENTSTGAKLADELSGCLRDLHNYARRIAKISNECKLEVIEDDYVGSFKPGLMDVVFQWASGMAFGDIVKTTDVFEGSIIRCLRRLEEVLRELVNAAKSMANKELEEKVEMARAKIKRDIVFAASLYL